MKLIIANWKLNPSTLKEAQELASSVPKKSKNKVVLCPPTIFLSQIKYPFLGAQDCFWEEKGPYTGQTSVLQLRSLSVKYCLIGHSENRALGETDKQINAKIRVLIRHKIEPVLCVGFGTKKNDSLSVIKKILLSQIKKAMGGIGKSRLVIAYEPVWAISRGLGTGRPADPAHAAEIAGFIRSKIANAAVLYGGSLDAKNARGFAARKIIAGGLVGGASLRPAEFLKIVEAFNN